MWWFPIVCAVISIIVISFLIHFYGEPNRFRDKLDKIFHVVGIIIKILFCVFGYISVIKFIDNDISLESLITRLVGMVILYFYFKNDKEDETKNQTK